MFKPELILRVLRFAAVGVVVMAFFMGMNWLFGRVVHAQVAFLLAYPPAVMLHFCLSKWWTFGDRSTVSRRQVSEYILMVLVTFGLQWVVFTTVMMATRAPGWLAAGVANAVQMIVTFLVMQRRIFARARTA